MKADSEKRLATDTEKRAAAKAAGIGKILAFEAENFKKLRVVRIKPDGNLVEITGKNGQGKTSVLDALWFALKGKAALPTKALRNGAEKLRVKLDLGAFTVTRTLGAEGTLPSLNLEMAKGKTAWDTPQAMLDGIVGELAFDPLEFVHMDAKAQVETLRKAVKLDVDIEDLNQANQIDYAERTLVNNEVKRLSVERDAIDVLDGLPKEKLDEEAILKRLNDAGEANRNAQTIFKAKQELGGKVGVARNAFETNERFIETQMQKLVEMREELRRAEDANLAAINQRQRLEASLIEAEHVYEAAPAGEPVDVTALTEELQSAQRTNRAIDRRTRYQALDKQVMAKKLESEKLGDAMTARDEKKRKALNEADIPVEGLTFDERNVLYKGVLLENLGEGEAIRISCQLGMALNPTLRVMRIPHGEALDEDGLALLAKMAEENDYQIWMSRVDSSGKIGIVLVDGMVAATNEGE